MLKKSNFRLLESKRSYVKVQNKKALYTLIAPNLRKKAKLLLFQQIKTFLCFRKIKKAFIYFKFTKLKKKISSKFKFFTYFIDLCCP